MKSVHDYVTEQNGKRILEATAEGKTVSERIVNTDGGYVNVVNRYGTQKDSSTQYMYQGGEYIPDMELTEQYIGNGIFVRIIDAPAEEAVKHGYDFGLNNPEIEEFINEELDRLDWEETAATAIKWARLYGGAIVVMLVDDGKILEDPLDWEEVDSIEELRVYERAIVEPDYQSMYDHNPETVKKRGSKFQMPEFYTVNSPYGQFKIHESRCLIFRNGRLPESTMYSNYRFFGIPEYIRLKDAMKDTVVAHADSVKLLERCIQAIYKMKNLSSYMETQEGEDKVLRRLEVIDLARGILNSLVIDAEGEDYDFKTMTLSGVKDIIDSTCNLLSALSNIPQTILFGRSPAGENSTGEGDLENYYNFVGKIQKMMLKKNMRIVLDLIFSCGKKNGDIEEIPNYKVKFLPLWSLSEKEQAEVDNINATTEQTKAITAQVYVDMQALDASEIRTGLKRNEEYTINDLLNEEDDLNLADLLGIDTEEKETVSEEAQNDRVNTINKQIIKGDERNDPCYYNEQAEVYTIDKCGVGVIIVKDGKILVGDRSDGLGLCGPGGHIESGECPEEAAQRETMEEFGIHPNELIPVGKIGKDVMPAPYCPAYFYLCTDYAGTLKTDVKEMRNPRFMGMEELSKENQFFPFRISLFEMIKVLKGGVPDG